MFQYTIRAFQRFIEILTTFIKLCFDTIYFGNQSRTESADKYRRKGSCRQRNTKHTPTSHAKDTHKHTTAHTASLKNQLVKSTRETYTKQM